MLPVCGYGLLSFIFYHMSVAHEIYFAAAIIDEYNASERNETFLTQVSVNNKILLNFENTSLSMVGLGESFVVNQKRFLYLVAKNHEAHVVGSSFLCTVLDAVGFACSISVIADGSDLAVGVANEEGLVVSWKVDNLTLNFPYNTTEYDMAELNRTLHLWSGEYDEWLYACGLLGFTIRTRVRSSETGTTLSCIVHSTCVPAAVYFVIGEKIHIPSCVQIGFTPDPLYSCGMILHRKRVHNASCEVRMGLGHVRRRTFEYETSFSSGRIRRSADNESMYTTPSPPSTTPSVRNIVTLPTNTTTTTMDPDRIELYKRIVTMGVLIVFIIVIAIMFMLCRNGLPCKKRGRKYSEMAVALAARRAVFVGGAVFE